MGKSVTRSNLSKTNEQRDYRIFEDYAYRLVDEARSVNTEKVFGLDGHIYAFDSTTIALCLEVFEWAKFRKHKGGIKVHTLYDIEAQVPTFFHITPAATNDMKAMPEIPYQKSAYYIFDRGYNDFANLYKIEQIEATFVVRAKKSLKFKQISWKRRLPKNILSDSTICFVVYKSSKDYPLSRFEELFITMKNKVVSSCF
ncbi:transposase [Bacteroides heparinolyticus]|uniref:Transposase n=1 Tax=Prevotella heparinolytica TaxID=28113 RepID=A0A449I7U6_9BACE|nr:transposase [Bacteroides heparinolyticus]